MKKIVIILSFLSLFVMPVFADQVQVTLDEAKLREFILQVIKDNPKLIYDLYQQHMLEERKKQEEQRQEESFRNRIKDIDIGESPAKGPENAAITIFEFSDFECPYCTRGSDTVSQIFKMYPGKIRVVFKNNPLKMHQQALSAAKASLAAARQGKYWEYHDRLFENSSNLNEEFYIKAAQELSLDMEKFNADRISAVVEKQIQIEQAQAAKYKLTGTPAFIINGVVVRGAKPLDYFITVIQRLLSEQPDAK